MTRTFRTCSFLAIFVTFLIPSSTRASCVGMQFGQLSPTFGYSYVHFPPNAAVTGQSVIGRYWNVGARSTTGESACEESFWLKDCDPSVYPCGAGQAGHVFYIDGNFGGMGCQSGCGENDMIVLLQDSSTDAQDAFFAVSRVPATPAESPLLFDYSSVGGDMTLTAIPRPVITSSYRASNNVTLTLSFPDPAPGFFGLPGAPASATITALHQYVVPMLTGQPDPGRKRSDWIFAQRYPYSGGVTTGSYTFDPSYYSKLLIATAIELDNGQLVTDYVGKSKQAIWDPDGFPGAGRVPDDSLRAAKLGTGELSMSWGTACTGSDFEVLEGPLGQYYNHNAVACSTGGAATLTFVPSSGDSYYLVVPTVPGGPALDSVFEGSHGRLRDGSERPVGTGGCPTTQRLAFCP